MKKVLITGANSFLGNNTKEYLEKTKCYQVDILDMLDRSWVDTDFSKYDVVFNVCAIVHRPDEKDENLYFAVNRDLAFKIAEKAKSEGVKQFIQTSTNGVFGIDVGEMSLDKGFHPRTPYEKSKLEADDLIESLRDEKFKVCIIRPPLIYGKGCKGNFPKLEKFALKFPVFPSYRNKKDFIYVLNMADFVKYAIDNYVDGICYPRDENVASVSDFVFNIAKFNNKKIRLWSIFNPFVKLLYKTSRSLRLVFGDNYCTCNIAPNRYLPWKAPFSLLEAIEQIYK